MKRRLIYLFILATCFPALACNFPGRNQAGSSLTGEQLRQTLQAQAVATLPGLIQTPQTETTSLPPGFTQTPGLIPFLTPEPGSPALPPEGYFSYFAQSGDTLPTLARRFSLSPDQITSTQPIPAQNDQNLDWLRSQ